MTESKPATPADNYDTLDAPELRRLLREKQGVVVQVIKDNQTAVTMQRRAEDAHREIERKMERMEKDLRAARQDVEELVKHRDTAIRFGASVYEKLGVLSRRISEGKKPKDVQQVVELMFHTFEQVSRLTMWPELDADFFEKTFEAAERRVFGSKGHKRPTDAKEFVERSVSKKKNTNGDRHGTEDPHQG